MPAGTYTAVQSVTISDATAGATIYFTTNGNTPTVSSPVYTGQAIAVTVTTIIKAIAVGAPGFANSAVATAIYTLNPDFAMTPYVSNFTIPNGLGGSGTFTLTPLFGFSGTVTMSCSGLPQGVTCSFLDAKGNADPSGSYVLPSTALISGVAYGSLVINVNQTTSMNRPGSVPFAPPAVFFGLTLALCSFRKRKRLAALMLLVFASLGVSALSGCGSGSVTGGIKTSTFTLNETSGGITHSQTITLNVSNLPN